MTATQIEELDRFLQSIESYAKQLSASDKFTQAIDAAQAGASETTQSFKKARAAYERFAEPLATPASTEEAAAIEAEKEQWRVSVDRLWYDYEAAKQSMLHLGNDLLETAADESRESGQLAKRFEYWSWALYIVGTILYGRVKSAMSTKPTSDA